MKNVEVDAAVTLLPLDTHLRCSLKNTSFHNFHDGLSFIHYVDGQHLHRLVTRNFEPGVRYVANIDCRRSGREFPLASIR
jgi:hypothetical protein